MYGGIIIEGTYEGKQKREREGGGEREQPLFFSHVESNKRLDKWQSR